MKLKLQYFGHLMWRTNPLEKTLMLGKIEVRRRRGWQRMRWLDSITELIGMILSKPGSCWWTGKPGMLSPWGHWELDMTEWLNWICLLRIIKKKKIYWDLMHKIIVTIYCICIFVHIEYSALGRLKKKNHIWVWLFIHVLLQGILNLCEQRENSYRMQRIMNNDPLFFTDRL